MIQVSPRTAGNGLAEQFNRGAFLFTGEIVPPVAGGPDELLALAAPLMNRLAGLNVTDGPGARVHMSSLAASALLVQHGCNPIMQMTCRDRNRIALQADLLGASALGVTDLLFLTGDDPSRGDQPDAKPVFDCNSIDLLTWSVEMSREGRLPSGRAIATPPTFFNGVADVPIAPPAGWVPSDLMRKADAGAHFVQTQLCYDIDIVRGYIGALVDHGLTDRLYVLLGTGPLAHAKSARWMNDNLFGVQVPEAIIERLERAADPRREGRKLCAEFIGELRQIPGLHGVHLMAPGNIEALPALLDDLAVPG